MSTDLKLHTSAPDMASPSIGRASRGYDVVAIGASAGGLPALQTVLHSLPADLGAAVVVSLHTAQCNRTIADTLARRTSMPVSWAEDGSQLCPGHLYVCPPYSNVELNPDATMTVAPGERSAHKRPISALFTSVAESFRERGMAVILTGMLDDGATGACALKRAGGTVLAQSVETCEYPSMPHAAIEAGAVDIVVALSDIGTLIADLVAGCPLPLSRSEREAIHRLFGGDTELPRMLREMDWARTPFGPVAQWPSYLQTATRILLETPAAACLLWGPDHIQIYNDQYRVLMGVKHPAGLGQPSRLCWPEVWHLNEPIFARVHQGEPVALEDALFPVQRDGDVHDTWLNVYFTPIRDERGAVAGILATMTETTHKVLAARRLAALHAVSEAAGGAATAREALERTLEAVERHCDDTPLAIAYLLDTARTRAQLVGAVGAESGGPMAPHTLDLGVTLGWPVADVMRTRRPALLEDLPSRFRGGLFGSGRLPLKAALLAPLQDADGQVTGLLVLGITPRLPLDDSYRKFLELLGERVSAACIEARGRHRERERVEALADLDRTKTEFFANVSHEFRTPLTLLLSPLEAALQKRDSLPEPLAQELDMITRSARRLETLVGSLLDFSQSQSGRLRARFEPVWLGTLTTELASLFRSAIERAGIRFTVECASLAEPVWVDVDMWEKILSNLIANALKFTFVGEISVRLKVLPLHVEVQVRDTGVGIPQEELPHIFKRFHQVRGTEARTQEGAGIGLALVQELVRLHAGRIRVTSTVGAGTTFTVWLPRGDRRAMSGNGRSWNPEEPPAYHNEAQRRLAATLAEQALSWVERPDAAEGPRGPLTIAASARRLPARVSDAQLLVVDDNVDMRAYLARILAQHWRVETAADGQQAYDAIRQRSPDLVVADVMMPRLDGFELLKRIRATDSIRRVPVILVTARAGEEAAIEGLLAGADDYISKPFSARELVVRVGAQLELSRVRCESEARYRALVNATTDIVFHMSADWTEMREIDGRGSIESPASPTPSWLDTYVPHEDRARVLAAIEEAMRSKSLFELEHRILRADGTTGWTFSRAVPLLDDRGETIEWFGTASDITARKQAEEALQARNDELERFNQVTVDHELRMLELEHQINDLRSQLGLEPLYPATPSF